MNDAGQESLACINKDPRTRFFPNTCWNCKNYYGPGLDEPEDKPFCVLDGCVVSEHQSCKDHVGGGWAETYKIDPSREILKTNESF